MIFEKLLKEALSDEDKPFETVQDLAVAIKSCLNAYGKVGKQDIHLPAFSKMGYTYKTHKREIAIKITGSEAHALIGEFKKANIHCRYSSVSDKLVIKFEDNVKTSGLLSNNTLEEIESGTYGVLGTTVEHQEDIKFNHVQTAIYNELNKYKLAQWSTESKKTGKTEKLYLVYKLIPEEETK